MTKGATTAGIGEFRSPDHRRHYEAAYDEAMGLCPAPAEQFDIGTRHGTTRVYRFGGARPDAPLVLLPGLLSTSAGFWQVLPRLSAERTVFTIDTLGEAGGSVQTAPFADLPDRAHDIDETLAGLGLISAHVIGMSTGGWHAVNLAIHAPARVASIGVVEPTTVTVGFSRTAIAFGVLLAVAKTDWTVRRFLRWSTGEDVVDRADIRLILAALRDYRPRVPFQFPFGDDAIRSIRVPVLAMFGGRSVVQDSVTAAARLQALLPDADVEVVAEAGHDLHLRYEDRVLDRVLGFVTDRSTGSGARPAGDRAPTDGAASTSASRSTTPPDGRSS